MRFNNIHSVPHWWAADVVALIVLTGEEAIDGEAYTNTGGKSDAWRTAQEQRVAAFRRRDDGVKCQRCSIEIQNPKVIKLESHLLKCAGYTLREKKDRKRVEEELAEERARRKSLNGGSTFGGLLSGCEAVVGSPSQAEADQLITMFV
ncbi:hypothetical protein DVH05_003586 [Phytophthora capsici]|nr:hypothetical protein DVH05_003586 [Phytophthora capsici]